MDKDELDDEVMMVPKNTMMELWRRYNEYKTLLRSMASEV